MRFFRRAASPNALIVLSFPGGYLAGALAKADCVLKNMGTKDIVELEGTVLETLPNASFRVKKDDGEEALAQISGRMRKYYIKIIPGDRVKMEFSPHDLTRGRVTYRYK